MSTDPNSGIAFMTMFDSANGTLSDGSQFSGVLIAPDEILTVAHGVTAADGTILNAGTAYLGHDGGYYPTSGGDAVAGVHVVDNSHRSGGYDTDSTVSSDYAVVHLATPVTNAQVFSLGVAVPGTYTITGYPAVNAGARTSVTEPLSNGTFSGELVGGTMVGPNEDNGASGSPIYSVTNGTPTVVGLLAAGNAQSDIMTGLTAADIAQIDAWVYSDDASASWGAAFAPPPAPQPPAPAPQPPAPTDRLAQLATLLIDAAQSTTGPRAQIMRDVASSLTETLAQGGSGGDIPDSAFLAGQDLPGISSMPRRAVAFMAGLMAGEAGVGRGRVMGYIDNVFGLNVSGQQMTQVAMAGYAEDKTFGSATMSAPIPAPLTDTWRARDLADAIGVPGVMTERHEPVAQPDTAMSMFTIAKAHHVAL